MAGTSSSSSQNTSQSSTQVLDYPERSFLDSIAQYAGTVGQNVYNWAQGEYAKNSALTDANVHNYLNTSQSALNQASGYQDTYRNTALPEAEKIIGEGNNYASPERMLMDMGGAESGQMQAGNAARQNAERDLQSFGIDPSSGRYAALDRASQVSSAAAAVGAAQQARQFDINTGQNLQQQGLNALNSTTGAFQGATTNAENTALQGFAGSENAGLANANTGVALQGAANPFLQTASSYKPITGTQSSSQGTSQSNSQTTDPPQQQKDPAQPKDQQQSGGGSSPSGSSSGSSNGSSSGTSGSDSGGDSSSVFNTGTDPFSGGTSGDNGLGGGFDSTDPFSSATGSLGDNTGSDSSSLSGDPSGQFFDPYGTGGGVDSGDSGITITPLGDMSSGSGSSADGGGDTSYAAGGAIDDDTGAIPDDGGQIPESSSPSGGLQTDDVQAQGPQGQINVNADEFVIPRDVALWKGQEFFQKLIAQSRQARVMAPARPSRGPPQAQGMR